MRRAARTSSNHVARLGSRDLNKEPRNVSLNTYVVQVHTGTDWETITPSMPFHPAVDAYIVVKQSGETRPMRVMRFASNQPR
jgi:hypothetical protein